MKTSIFFRAQSWIVAGWRRIVSGGWLRCWGMLNYFLKSWTDGGVKTRREDDAGARQDIALSAVLHQNAHSLAWQLLTTNFIQAEHHGFEGIMPATDHTEMSPWIIYNRHMPSNHHHHTKPTHHQARFGNKWRKGKETQLMSGCWIFLIERKRPKLYAVCFITKLQFVSD